MFEEKIIKNKFVYIILTLFFFLILGIGVSKTYKNYQNNMKELNENYIKINGEITFVGKTGTGIRAKALLRINYNYDNRNYSGTVTRKYEKEGYYKKGDIIIVYINKNTNEIK